jgi:selenide,water dikinase
VTKEEQLLLCDAQTSGGLLIAVEEKKCDALLAALTEARAICAAVVGRLEAGDARMRVDGGAEQSGGTAPLAHG